MILVIDGETHTLESNMRNLVINNRETTADEWNRPNSIEQRINSKIGHQARHAFVHKATDKIVPRRGGWIMRSVRWLSEDVR